MRHSSELILAIGAAARLTRLITSDTIAEPLRTFVLYDRKQRAARKQGQPLPRPVSDRSAEVRTTLHTLLTCSWCTGFWMTAMVGAVMSRHGHRLLVRRLAQLLTGSYVVGWLASHDGS